MHTDADILDFYDNKKAVDNASAFFNIILESWPDETFYNNKAYIGYLFPRVEKRPKLAEKFQFDKTLRKKIYKILTRFLKAYGFKIISTCKIENFDPLKTGKISTHMSQRKFYEIMKFLTDIGMSQASALVFLGIMVYVKADPLLEINIQNGIFPFWVSTQPYIRDFKGMNIYELDMNFFQAQFESECEESEESEESEKENVVFKSWDDSIALQDFCASFRGLQYTGNSCYQDSTLLALFAVPNKIIESQILTKNLNLISRKEFHCTENMKQDVKIRKRIQNELIRITNSMRGGTQIKTCSNLRNLFKNCQGSQEFHETETQDAGEFLQYLFKIFEVKNKTYRRVTLVSNEFGRHAKLIKVYENIYTNESPIISISPYSIADKKEDTISSFIKTVDDAVLDIENLYTYRGESYQRKIEINEVLAASFLVFHIQRLYVDLESGREVRNQTAIIPPEYIVIGKNNLILRAIVVHQNNHYTCYIICNGVWYYYDDTKTQIFTVGSYEKMIENKPSPLTKGVLYFYV